MARILVVDDARNIRDHLASYVRQLGHTVRTAADGTEGLAAIGAERFDLVLSDVRTEDLPDRLLAPAIPGRPAVDAGAELSLEDLERRHVEHVLGDSASLEEAAARLGINPTTLWRKRKRWGLR